MSAKVIEIPTKVWRLLNKAAILFAVCWAIGSMINFVSPRVTLTMDPEERFWFWTCLCLIGGAGTFICECVLTYFDIKWSSLSKGFAGSVCGTIAVLLPLYVLYDPAEIPNFSTTVMFVWTVMVLILIGTFMLGLKILTPETAARSTLQTPKTPPLPTLPVPTLNETPDAPDAIPEESVKILERLPVHLQNSELYAISSEDHYVRVHTSKGDDMILMRLSDAMLEIGTLEGLQIHRSWWVAKAAIEDIKPKGRTAEITLKNNVKAPVSRNKVKTLKTIGWL